MLTTISLVAIFGGILAFKVMTPADYCTEPPITTTVGGPQVCTNAAGVALECPQHVANTIYTVTTATTNIICTVTAPNEHCTQPNGTPVRCFSKAKVTIE